MEKEKRTVNLPSCKINNKALEAVCEFIDQQRHDMREGEHEAEFGIEIEANHESFKFNSCEEFLEKDIPKELKAISFSLSQYLTHQRIEIHLGFNSWRDSEISVSGNNSVWVKGVVEELRDIFARRSTWHNLLHKNNTGLLIFGGFGMLTGFIVVATFFINDRADILTTILNGGFSLPLVFGIGVVVTMVYWSLFKWLFPIIEFEGIGIQQKIRKGVLVAIGSLWGLLTYVTNL